MTVDATDGTDPHDAASPPRRVTRRRLLAGVGTLSVTGLVTLGGIAVVDGSTDSPVPSALAANLARLPGVEQLRAIGEAAEGAGVLDRPVDEVAALVAPRQVADPISWCSRTGPATLRDHVADMAQFDFTSGAVVEVDGWRLSRTEAALSLLVARS